MDLSFYEWLGLKYMSCVSDTPLLHAELEKIQIYKQGWEPSSRNGPDYKIVHDSST